MKTTARAIAVALAVSACFAPGVASAFVSSSTGADGPFNPTVNTTVALPPSGIFNYTSVIIPAGVTVKFLKNTANTPVVILATGDVTIAGTLNLTGSASADVGSAGDGALGDDGTPGVGGPGGFDGGRGGVVGSGLGGTGLGPGGGQGGVIQNQTANCAPTIDAGGGGGFGTAGGNAGDPNCTQSIGGSAYGSSQILPLIGGSGGGGGTGGDSLPGSGGGGGGGALLIAASGTVNVTGAINASGGASGAEGGGGFGCTGGGGSGGAIRIMATTISGNGAIFAQGAISGQVGRALGGFGGDGRIRLEAETFNRTAATLPTASISTPGPVFVAGAPALAISSVAGVSAPANPKGNADITLASSTPNPVTVVFTTTGVPVGNTVQLTVTPAFGSKTTVVTPALTGSTASATASVSINLPVGPSVLQAQTTFTIVASLGDLLKNFAGNERVEKITLSATLGGKSKATLITVSGKKYEAPAEALQIALMGG